jgi:hypothetical protein
MLLETKPLKTCKSVSIRSDLMRGISPLSAPPNFVFISYFLPISPLIWVNYKSFNLSRVRTSQEVEGEEAGPTGRYCHAHPSLSLTPEIYLSRPKRHRANAADLPVTWKHIHFSLQFSARKCYLCIWNAILKLWHSVACFVTTRRYSAEGSNLSVH